MSEPFLGEIRLFAGSFAPRDWALCNGQLLSIQQNTALFAILGTTYGGDGKTTFALPNLQDRVPLNFGQGPGLAEYALGQSGGEESVTLMQSEMPAHGHQAMADSSGSGVNASPANAVWTGTPPRGGAIVYSSSAGSPVPMSPMALQPTGGSQPHNNQQPFLALTFIIALQGIFPVRS